MKKSILSIILFLFIVSAIRCQFVVVHLKVINSDSRLHTILAKRVAAQSSIKVKESLIFKGFKQIAALMTKIRMDEYELSLYDKSVKTSVALNQAVNTTFFATPLAKRSLMYFTAAKALYFGTELGVSSALNTRMINFTPNENERNANTHELYLLRREMMDHMSDVATNPRNVAKFLFVMAILQSVINLDTNAMNVLLML